MGLAGVAVGHVNLVTGSESVLSFPPVGVVINYYCFSKFGRTGAMSSFSFDYCFLAEVTASNLNEDKLYLPVGATSSTPLHKQCQETILVNKEGNLWNVSLRFSESGGKYYITRGWRKFCLDNRCEIRDLFVFNVVGDRKTTPLMCVCPERKECSEILSKYLSRKSGESSLGGDS
ncbi:hypothetical protein HID58_053698 [Brassica napus]|uniref:TF-B3 domain-containing protein n=1 Tax=Brassica napus TaxID=3708 RepID=A0ABQ8AFF7_BRANA|nr:hypothetical protein HID58_053698 [Brassica napus]